MLETLGLVLVFMLAMILPRTILAIAGLAFVLGWWWLWVALVAVVAFVADIVFLLVIDTSPELTDGSAL